MSDYIETQQKKNQDKIQLENIRKPSDFELETVAEVYRHFYKWRDERSGTFAQMQYKSFEDMLKISRNIFWNSTKTASEDLQGLGLDFSMGFARKEVKDFIGKLVSMSIKPRFHGHDIDAFGVKVLQAMYDKWRMHSNDRVEKFWELLYGIVNGTVCKFIGYNDAMTERRFLRKYDPETGDYEIEKKEVPFWDDVWGEIVPIEDIYLSKLYERNMRKQGRLIWKTQIDWKDFKREFSNYDNAEYVYPGNRLSDDSLYFKLLGGSGITTTSKVEVIKHYDEVKDEFILSANGVWLNPMGKKKQEVAPMPFNHKHLPFVWGIIDPIDEKLAYGMPMPFAQKDPHKLLNTSFTMLMERELRTISPPILTSDIEAPDIIFGEQKVIPVNDVNAYKEMEIKPAQNDFFTTINSLQSILTNQSQGGSSNIMQGRQPKSAKEQLALQQQQQVFMANTLLMYYDMIRQEVDLVLKTAIQFYPMARYREHSKNLVRAINVPNTALTGGGTGNLEVRMVKKKSTPIELFIESVQTSILNGKQTEIIEAPLEVFEELDFDITRIELEQEKLSEQEQQSFMERVMTPMVNVFMPMGLVDPQKLMLRYLDKMKEHPADYMPDKVLPQAYSTWQTQYQVPQMPQNPGQRMGSMQQSNRGIQFGGAGNQGMGGGAGKPVGSPPFGSQQSQSIGIGQ